VSAVNSALRGATKPAVEASGGEEREGGCHPPPCRSTAPPRIASLPPSSFVLQAVGMLWASGVEARIPALVETVARARAPGARAASARGPLGQSVRAQLLLRGSSSCPRPYSEGGVAADWGVWQLERRIWMVGLGAGRRARSPESLRSYVLRRWH
jgi:hypothetical protein